MAGRMYQTASVLGDQENTVRVHVYVYVHGSAPDICGCLQKGLCAGNECNLAIGTCGTCHGELLVLCDPELNHVCYIPGHLLLWLSV